MAPREHEILEILQRLDTRQDGGRLDRRKSIVQITVAIVVPTVTVIAAAASFFYHSQENDRKLDAKIVALEHFASREIAELKSQITQLAVLERARLQGEIDKQQREIERLKK
jgi:hypothetical protein